MKHLFALGPPLAFGLYAFGWQTTLLWLGSLALIALVVFWFMFFLAYIGGGL